MYKNGVSHLTAQNDLDGVSEILDWMSYLPECRGGSIPITPSIDSWDRPIEFQPIKGAYDPRWFLAGKEEYEEDTESGSGSGQVNGLSHANNGTSRFLSGFFDKGSFQETLSGWAQTVVSVATTPWCWYEENKLVEILTFITIDRSLDAPDWVESRWGVSPLRLERLSESYPQTPLTPLRVNRRSWKLVK